MSHSTQKDLPPSKNLSYTLLAIGVVISLLILATIPVAGGIYFVSLFQVPCLLIVPISIFVITATGTIGGSVVLLRGSWGGLILYGIGILPVLLLLIGAGGVVTAFCPLHV